VNIRLFVIGFTKEGAAYRFSYALSSAVPKKYCSPASPYLYGSIRSIYPLS
jgi:hypothetical protein